MTHEKGDQRSIERLDSIARSVYSDMRLNQQAPIAVVGSGLSVPYGGISWKEAATEGLVEALRQLDLAAGQIDAAGTSPSRALRSARVARAKRSVLAFQATPADGSDELYLAMQIVEDGILTARASAEDAADLGHDFKSFMAKLFGEERFRLERQALRRIGSKTDDEVHKQVTGTQGGDFDSFLATLYSFPMLERIAPESLFPGIVADLRAEYGLVAEEQPDTLPPDRRSLLALLLAARRGADPDFTAEALWSEFGRLKPIVRSCMRPLNDPIREVHAKLGIRRFITLNYDHELERALMLDDVRAIEGAQYGFDEALRDGVIVYEPGPGASGAAASAGVKRRFSDGMTASSDVYQASAAAHLFEFALNSPDYRLQIVHQHGRADMPTSMVLTDRDLNKVYRHDRYSSTTLEQALDVILTGNPILFIGLGLTEAEITRPLRQLVGEGRAALDDPAFAIMVFDKSKGDDGYEEDGGVAAWRRQVGLFRQYGIHLFDAGHPRHGSPAFNQKLAALDALTKAIKPPTPAGPAEPIVKDRDPARQTSLHAAIAKCREAGVARGISLDETAFEWLLDILGNGKFKVDPGNHALVADYLGYLTSKHYTHYLIEEIRRLGRHAAGRFLETTYQRIDGVPESARSVRNDDVREGEALAFRPRSVRHAVSQTYLDMAPETDAAIDRAVDTMLASIVTGGITLLVGELGSGKGTTLDRLRQRLTASTDARFCHISCSMALEFDSAIFQMLRFVNGVAFPGTKTPLTDRLNALQEALEQGPAAIPGAAPLIVISGIERLLDAQSRPLTPELELVVKMLLHPDVIARGWHVLIAGTSTAIAWVEREARVSEDAKSMTRVVLQEQYGGLLVQLSQYAMLGARRDELKGRIGEWRLYPREPYVPNGARSPASNFLIGLVLENWHDIIPPGDGGLGATRARAELDRQILQNLAYVGQPVARAVLQHMPDVRRAASKAGSDMETAISDACGRLADAGLAMGIVPFPNEPGDAVAGPERMALPRIVLAELRERFGVRSGEEQLSNSFTLTLAASMPSDLVIPDDDVSLTLGKAVGHLRAAWKDANLGPEAEAALEALRTKFGGRVANLAPLLAETAGSVERVDQIERLALMAAVPAEEALRAAAAIVRGFFSAATLVSNDPSFDTHETDVTAQFDLHRKRVDLLLERTREVRRIEDRILAELEALGLPAVESASYAKALAGAAGEKSPPLYSGELIWLLNEAGVIAQLQGNLKAAERSFREAGNALERFKGMGARHTWRRLAINQAFLGIERGRIVESRAQLNQLLRSIDEPRLRIGDDPIRAESDDRVCRPIALGYLGLVDALGGHFESAKLLYGRAIEGLIESDQQRGLALFYWRLGTLDLFSNDQAGARGNLALAIAEAESARQMDVVWRARLTMTELQRESDPAMVATVFREARAYADAMKMPRLQVIALRREAEWRMERDDLTVAAALATQAMQRATRNGMVLMRISLRTLMGSIMIRQGDASGEFLLQRAIRHADRIGYQLQVNQARNALLSTKVASRH